MYLFYSILLTIGVIVLLPRLALDAVRHGKYVTGIWERLGRLPRLERSHDTLVWLHCVSVGETQAARPLVQAIRERFPSHKLVVSTTTLTGQRLAREIFRDEAILVFYFPFDWRWTVRKALGAIRPTVVLIMETELWPNFLRECRRREIRTAIVNGRLSERSYRRYRYVRRFVSTMVGNLDLALMQSEPDAQRMRALGLPPERVRVTGNMKFDTSVDRAEHHLTAEFRHRFGLSDGRQLIVAASTHEPEEQITIDAYQELRKRYSDRSPRLLIAPRHPERFAQTASLLNESGLSWTRRSREPKESDTKCDAILLDSIGELRAVYPLADIVFVGGSIAPNGGHNILEPVVAGACVVTGAHTHNFTEIINAFVDADALIQLLPVPEPDAPKALAFAFAELLESDEKRDGLVSRARGLVESNRGATDQTIELIGTLMNHGEQLKEVETEARGSSDN